jgi:hypothetical protein
MARKEYEIDSILVNGRIISKVIIDDHYKKHTDISSDLILQLVSLLNGVEQVAEDTNGPYQYFSNLIKMNENQYKLVWLLEDSELYIGVITTYRDSRRK